jgi:aspartate aminotransferase
MMQFLSVGKSGTLSFNEKTKQIEQEGRTVHKFGFGESPFLPPLHVRQAFESASHRKDYTSVAGLPELREKIAEFHSETDGYPIETSQVLVAPGTKPLLYNLMHAFQDATVFLPAPSWVSYAPQAHIARHDIHLIPTNFEERWRVTPANLDQVLSTYSDPAKHNLMVLNYPGNPDGLTYSRQELLDLTDILRKHSVWVISDEIYGLLHHEGQHVSLASVYPERTMVTTGLSKWCGAGGWRLGALILPADAPAGLMDAMIGLGSETYSCASAPVQVAAMSAYELDGNLHQFLAGQRKIIGAIGHQIHRKLSSVGIQVHPPQGGFYLLLDLSPFADQFKQQGIESDIQLCEQLLDQTGVALLPGISFGMPSDAFTARLAYVDFDGTSALADIDSFESNGAEAFVARHASKMMDGTRLLCEWLS